METEPGRGKKEDYPRTLEYLFGLQVFGIKLGLVNITSLLKRLGNPQRQWQAIHIAGTNGKGSTAAFLDSILREAGYRVGLYTSPHLVDFSERIRVNGKAIPQDRVVRLTGRIRRITDRMTREGAFPSPCAARPGDSDAARATITYFEFVTALAFLYFRESRVDVAVLETGMGGRLDATNVVDPLLSLITPISLEHQQYLGKTLVRIAQEKAGIIKLRRPVLTTARQPQVRSVIEQRSREMKSPLYIYGRDFQGRRAGPQLMNFQGRRHRWNGLRLGLLGEHQVLNASLALAAAEVLLEKGFSLKEEHLRSGLEKTRWPGRLELIGSGPRILLDGAHNPGAAAVLKKNLQREFPRRRLILVLGMMADKDIPRMMAHLVPLADRVILTRPRMARAATTGRLKSLAAPFRKRVAEIEEVSSAVESAWEQAGEKDLVVISGSLFTVGEARAYLQKEGILPA